MTQVTINGHTYSDDGKAARDMTNGGAKTWLLPLAADIVAVGAIAEAAAEAATTAAITSEAAASAQRGTSTTSVSVGTGAKAFTTQPGKYFDAPGFVLVYRTSNPAIFMVGQVTSYNSGTGALAISVPADGAAGSGTYTDWSILVTGQRGSAGGAGYPVVGQRSTVNSDTVALTDRNKVLSMTGTGTIGFAACSTLGDGYSVYLQNRGSGLITLDPNDGETIDGAASKLIHPGQSLLVSCNATSLATFQLERGSADTLIFQDQKPSATDAAGSPSAGYSTREFNTVLRNTLLGASIASNQITLTEVGEYEADIVASGAVGGRQHLSLRETAGLTFVLLGLSQGANQPVSVRGRFRISGPTTLDIRHYTSSAYSFGSAVGGSRTEVYLTGRITRIST